MISIDINALTGKKRNMSVEFLKQVEISSKQPYFQPNFPNKQTLVAMNPPQYQTLLPHLFF
ncbi:MAG: hypothetical protein LBT09_02910 [Planctomycetaceae bacterium]|jgi:hypothetical protein|nr:hypothetical protein [Planctomycetaceae bacterium]